ncbi:anoctamin-7-like protein, partial [Leptotrombidium deliense]
ANKLITETRRPVGERAQDIGIWYNILEFLASFAVFTNAFLIAFTSDFLTRTLYYVEYGSMDNYLNFTLSTSASSDKEESHCRYKDFRQPNGHYIPFYWKLMFIRCAFILIFQISITLIRKLIDILIPDIPTSLDLKMKREQYLARKQLEDM